MTGDTFVRFGGLLNAGHAAERQWVRQGASHRAILSSSRLERDMSAEFTAVVERDDDCYITYSPEVPGANGQGKSKEEALQSLSDAISLILEDRREDGLRGIPKDAVLEKVTVK
jgi:predicted RNase H-like HicB family nuclease